MSSGKFKSDPGPHDNPIMGEEYIYGKIRAIREISLKEKLWTSFIWREDFLLEGKIL